MSHRTATLVLPALLALGLIARDGAAQTPGAPAQPAARTTAGSVDLAAEEQAIRAISQQWLAAQRRKDVNGVMAFYADDAVAVYGGQLLAGPAAIRQNLERQLAEAAAKRPGFTPSWETTAVRVAQSGDLAYEAGTYDDQWNAGKGRERGHFLTVYRKVGGQWKVAQDLAAAAPDAAPTP